MKLKSRTGDSFMTVDIRTPVFMMMKIPVLVFLVLAMPSGLPLSPAAGPSPQIGRELQGTITVTITGSGTWRDEGAEKPSHGKIENTASHRVRISTKQCSPPNAPGGLRAFCGKEMAFAASVFEERGEGESNSITKGKISGRCPGGSDIALQGLICEDGMVYYVVDPSARTYSFVFNTLVVPALQDQGEGMPPQEYHAEVPGFRIEDIPLPNSPDVRLTGSKTYYPWNPYEHSRLRNARKADLNAYKADTMFPYKAVVSWDFGPPPPPLTVEVNTEENYDKWEPKGNIDDVSVPGNSLHIRAKVRDDAGPMQPRKARLHFLLENVSENRGVCANWPPAAEAVANKGLLFRKEDFPEGGPLIFNNDASVETRDLVEEADVRVYSHDYGAWGTLRITAKDQDGNDVTVKVLGKETSDLDIPKDDDENLIGDFWEPEVVRNKSKDWDDEEVANQDQKGDGVTLYTEYRGVVVMEGGIRVWKRLSPKQKEMFIIDPDQAFPGQLWKDRTGIEALGLEESAVDPGGNREGSPLVNFNCPDKQSHPFFALKVRKISGDRDPDPAVVDDKGHTQPPTTGQPPYTQAFPLMAYAAANGSIRSADYIKVFPDRARIMVNYYLEWLSMGLRYTESDAGKELKDPKNQFSLEEALRAWEILQNPGAQGALVKRMVNVFFIHEMGHVCGDLPDHGGNPPDGHKEEARACFMWNMTTYDQRRLIVLSALGRGDSNFAYSYANFCQDLPVPDQPFHCYRSLKVKDW